MAQCSVKVADFAKEAGIEIKEAQLREFEQRFEQLVRKNPFMSKAQAYRLIGRMVEEDEVLMAEKVRTARFQELRLKTEGVARVRDTRFGADVVDNLEALLSGKSDRVAKGGNLGIRAQAKAFTGRWMSKFMMAIENDLTVLQAADKKSPLSRAIIHALNGETHLDGAPIDPVATRVAKAFNDIMAEVSHEKKLVNPFFEEIKDYFFRQTHSREEIMKSIKREGGGQYWVNKVLSLMGDKSYPDLAPMEQMVKVNEVLNAILEDRYSSSYSKDAGNKMYKMARERKLIPNNADAFHEYHAEFGDGNIFEVMQKTIRQASNDIAVMQTLGGNPADTYAFIKRVATRDANDAVKTKLKNREKRLDALFGTALGYSSVPADSMVGKASQAILAWQSFQKLAGVYLSLVDDVHRAHRIIEATTGENSFANIARMTRAYMNGFFSAEQAKEMGKYVEIWTDAYHGGVMSELGSIENAPGVMGRVAKGMNKLNFMEQHTRGAAPATAIAISTILADKAHLTFDQLHTKMKYHLFERYNFDEHDWNNVMRHAVEDVGMQGNSTKIRSLVTPEAIRAMPDEAFAQSLRARQLDAHNATLKRLGKAPVEAVEGPISSRMIEQERARVANQFGAMLNDIAEAGTSTASTHEFAYMHRGLDINDPVGAFLRFLWTFKSASLKNYNTTKRLFYSGLDPQKGNWAGVAKLVGAGFTLYAMKRWAQDAISGKTPSDPSNVKDFVAPGLASAVAGGPALDILMHVFQQENDVFTEGKILQAAAGPVFSDAVDYLDLAHKLAGAPFGSKKVKADDIAAKALRIGVLNGPVGPFLKLPYTKSLADYYITDEIRQVGNRRYLRHERERMEDTAGMLTGQGAWAPQTHFMLDPSNK